MKTSKIIYPAFLIVNRMRGTNEVIAVIEGDASQDTMINRLMQSYEMFESQRIKGNCSFELYIGNYYI